MEPGYPRKEGASSTTPLPCIAASTPPSRGTPSEEYDSYVKDYTPEWVDILNGMAAGAADAGIEVTYEDLLAFYALYEEFLPWSEKSFVIPEQPTCSGFAAWGKATKGGRLVCAGNGDDNIGFFSSTVVVFPETGNAFIASPYNLPGFGGFPSHPGMNDKGARPRSPWDREVRLPR